MHPSIPSSCFTFIEMPHPSPTWHYSLSTPLTLSLLLRPSLSSLYCARISSMAPLPCTLVSFFSFSSRNQSYEHKTGDLVGLFHWLTRWGHMHARMCKTYSTTKCKCTHLIRFFDLSSNHTTKAIYLSYLTFLLGFVSHENF